MSACEICKKRLTRKSCNNTTSNICSECKDTIKKRNYDIVINDDSENKGNINQNELSGVNIENNTIIRLSTCTSSITDDSQNSVLSNRHLIIIDVNVVLVSSGFKN